MHLTFHDESSNEKSRTDAIIDGPVLFWSTLVFVACGLKMNPFLPLLSVILDDNAPDGELFFFSLSSIQLIPRAT